MLSTTRNPLLQRTRRVYFRSRRSLISPRISQSRSGKRVIFLHTKEQTTVLSSFAGLSCNTRRGSSHSKQRTITSATAGSRCSIFCATCKRSSTLTATRGAQRNYTSEQAQCVRSRMRSRRAGKNRTSLLTSQST